ncbi:MAG: hypothetical protein EHM61_03570 [Acidobacteria bacterium]|nr:MAG: hypothetical protein EHM61_03570 [Acidobacteriota bacterium]
MISNTFQLIVTLGPASLELIEPLIDAGASTFRLNTAHMAFDSVEALVRRVRSFSDTLPIVLDLQGAKMRLGTFPERQVTVNQEVIFAIQPSNVTDLPMEHAELVEQARPGDVMSVDDDRLRFQILEKTDRSLVTRTLSGGLLKSRKGINIAQHPVDLRGLREFDKEICRLAGRSSGTGCAISFMKDGHEADWVRHLAPHSPVVGKIERAEALPNFEAISERVESVWICRGDLGAQIGPAPMAKWISSITPRSLNRPVLMAGQVMEHLTSHREPTRTEVCHLYDLVSRGYAGIVLSDETAIGGDPVRAARETSALVRAFQHS